MKYIFLFTLLLPHLAFTQSKLTGLSPFLIGVTTPESLGANFREQELVVVKGTLALPCASVRVFIADTVLVQGILVTQLHLVFHENRLFRLTCDYRDSLQKTFVRQFGKGRPDPDDSLSLCNERQNRRLALRSYSWQNGDIRALAIKSDGYNEQCQPERTSRLTIASLSLVALTSECDLEHLDPYLEKYWPKR